MNIPDQSGRVALITGANAGLGFETARALAARGAHVILACRDAAKGAAARERLLAEHPTASASVEALDVSKLDSVRACAARVLAAHPRLDLLINNAGIMATPLERTAEGFEMQLASNHLGHFLLTGLLLPRLLATPGSRVVAVSSLAARQGHIDFDDLMGTRRYDPWTAYNQSKLANLLFGRELQRRLERVRAPTRALIAHPGASSTNLFSTPGGVLVKRVVTPLMRMFLFQSAERGALPILFAATSADAEPGGYYGPGGFNEMKGPPAPARVPPAAKDDTVASRLWTESERLVGLRYPEGSAS